jgi:hypothetical protein
MPKKDQYVSETEIQDENIYAALLANIEEALQNNPRAAHAFATLMWLVGDAAKKGRGRALITEIVNASIGVAYEHTSDHQGDHHAGLERFKSVLDDDCGSK